jgi:hypothetical protein
VKVFCSRFAEQLALLPPFNPLHLHSHCDPLRVGGTGVAVPALQRPVAGAVLNVPPLAVPQTPLTGIGAALLAEQLAAAPPFSPVQLHVHGPLPLTAVAVPVLQRFVVGALLNDWPLADPQAPLTGVVETDAEQLAFVPLFTPLQLHVHGPLPLTAVAVPALQRFVVGALLNDWPLADPQAPLTGEEIRAAQVSSLLPPFNPVQLHVHNPPLLPTGVGVPALQRFVAGAVANVPPFAVPQAPLTTGAKAEQFTVAPPFDPLQLHVHCDPLRVGGTGVAVPLLQRLVVGAVGNDPPFAVPQAPSTGVTEAEQFAVVPPFDPLQFHVHGPLPKKLPTVPEEHKPLLVEVNVVNVWPFAVPQAPLTGVTEAEQFAVVPPFDPLQSHVHGPLPKKLPTVPEEHKPLLVDVNVGNVPPFAVPQPPLTKAPASGIMNSGAS